MHYETILGHNSPNPIRSMKKDLAAWIAEIGIPLVPKMMSYIMYQFLFHIDGRTARRALYKQFAAVNAYVKLEDDDDDYERHFSGMMTYHHLLDTLSKAIGALERK